MQSVCMSACLCVYAEMDMGWVHPWVGLGWVGLNEKYLLLFCSLHFVFVVISCAKKICK